MVNLFKWRVVCSRILLPVLTVWLCVMPGRSYAYVPAAIGGYGLPTLPESGSYAAAAGGAAITVGAAAFAVGMVIGYYGLEYLLGDGTPEHVRIPLTEAQSVPPPSPPGSVAALQSAVFDVDPMSDCWATVVHNCPDMGTFNCTGAAVNVVTIDALHVDCHISSTNWPNWQDNTVYHYTATVSWSCPAGYTLSGSVCVVVDVRAASPDHSCDFARAGTSLAAIADPDCQAALLKMPFLCANGTCTGQGVDSAGQPLTYAITPRVDGGSTLETVTQKVVNGQTQVTTSTVGISSGGIVVSVSGDVQAGSLPSSTTGGAVAPVISPSPTQQEAPVQPITFPNDYARTGEAQTAANTLAPKLDSIHHDLSDTVAVVDPVAPVAGDMPSWGNTFTNLLSWHLPAHSSACPQPSMDLSGVLGSGHVYTMTAHCDLFNNNAAPLHAAMVVVFSVLAVLIVLRA